MEIRLKVAEIASKSPRFYRLWLVRYENDRTGVKTPTNIIAYVERAIPRIGNGAISDIQV
jgi:hypothetical protein